MSGTAEPGDLRPVVVVTGASEGIGRAFARLYASNQRDLLLVARRPDPLEKLAGELREKHGVRVDTQSLDVTAPDATATLDDALGRAGAYCDVLVNSAGIGLSGAYDSHRWDEVAGLIALDVTALSRLMHHVLPGMRRRRRGGVINLSSLGGFGPGPYQAAYHASRAYVLSLSEAVAAEVASDGVRVTAVAPGPVRTRFHAKMGSDNDNYRRFVPPLSPTRVARWGAMGHSLGMRVVVPGFVNNLLALSLRLMPHRITVPIEAWLYRPRNR